MNRKNRHPAVASVSKFHQNDAWQPNNKCSETQFARPFGLIATDVIFEFERRMQTAWAAGKVAPHG